MTLRLGMNARRLEGQRLGVGRYLEYLLKHWDRMLADDGMALYVRAPFARQSLGLSDRYTVHHLTPRLTGVTWENVHLPRAARDLDVLFCPNYSAPLTGSVPCVVAIHSMNEVQPGAHGWSYRYTYAALYRASARRAVRVVVPSESTRQDLIVHYDVPAERIDIVEQGADDDFRPIEDTVLLAETRRRFVGDDVPYVLFVGKLSERRNIPALIQGFKIFKERTRLPHRLLLVGPNHVDLPLARLVGEAGLDGQVVQTDGKFDDHRALVPIYNAADVFVHPSLYEGFSMTTVEALACGTAVIAANRGGLAEVARGHARMLDTPDAASIGEALAEVLTDDTRRAELKRASRARGQTFRWENTARETLAVLRRVAAEGAR